MARFFSPGGEFGAAAPSLFLPPPSCKDPRPCAVKMPRSRKRNAHQLDANENEVIGSLMAALAPELCDLDAASVTALTHRWLARSAVTQLQAVIGTENDRASRRQRR